MTAHHQVSPVALRQQCDNPIVRVVGAERIREITLDAFVESIVWGWKRDTLSPPHSRLVYFSAQHRHTPHYTYLESPFFYYSHAGPTNAMSSIEADLASASVPTAFRPSTQLNVLQPDDGTTIVTIVSGRPTAADIERLSQLAMREPDPAPVTPPTAPPCREFDLRALGVNSFDLLAGSGLSYEAGLPQLKAVHDTFWVDDGDAGFCMGAKDQLPRLLVTDIEATFRSFADWHVRAALAHPSRAHVQIARLRDARRLHRVFTDNIDQLFELVGIRDYQRVRGSGVVNEFQPVSFDPASDALLVVGVSADRRGVIAQAHDRGLRIVVINPYEAVSPGAKNLEYLRAGDIYYPFTAGVALPRLTHALIGSTPASGHREALAGGRE